MRMRKKKNLVPRMERCAAQLIRDPYEHRGHWRDLMPQARELRLEKWYDPVLILALVVIVAALLVFSPKMPEGQALHKAGTGKEERTL